MRAQHFFWFYNSRMYAKDLVSKLHKYYVAVSSKAVIILLFIYYLLLLPLCWALVLSCGSLVPFLI